MPSVVLRRAVAVVRRAVLRNGALGETLLD